MEAQLNIQNSHPPLSARELEVFELLVQGFYYREISARLGISYATVHTHLKHIYKKLKVRSRNQAVAKYLMGRSFSLPPCNQQASAAFNDAGRIQAMCRA